MTKRIKAEFTKEQADALRWVGNIGLRYAADEGPHPATVEAAQRALETITKAMGLVPYRRGNSVYGRLTVHESSRAKH